MNMMLMIKGMRITGSKVNLTEDHHHHDENENHNLNSSTSHHHLKALDACTDSGFSPEKKNKI